MSFDREIIRDQIATLARSGAYIGTSSWKYAGWRGQLYDDARYVYRGRFAESRFEKNCLAEYAEVFKTVCVDAAYYTFPSERQLVQLAAQVPDDFRFAFKVTDEITIKQFPNLDRFGRRAGQPNPNFLNADLFARMFLEPCRSIQPKVGVLIFEFSKFHGGDFARGLEFVGALDQFLSRLPAGWPYAVEIRNRTFLQPEYFAMLARHNVAHTFSSWQDMLPVDEQVALPDSRTSRDVCAARLLLRPGRKYQEAVDLFKPYDQLRDPYPEARDAGAKILREAMRETRRKTYVYVNNRLEGNALATIAEMLRITLSTMK